MIHSMASLKEYKSKVHDDSDKELLATENVENEDLELQELHLIIPIDITDRIISLVVVVYGKGPT